MPNIELLLEAEKRGILPQDKIELLNEARKRGLVASNQSFPSPTPKQTNAKHKQKPPDTYGVQFAKNLVPDTWDLLKSIGSQVRHPIDTAKSLANIGAGALGEFIPESMVKPEQKQDFQGSKQAWENFIKPITESIQNPSGIPKRVLEYTGQHPARALNTAALGLGVGGKILGKEGIGKSLQEAGQAIDPINTDRKSVV